MTETLTKTLTFSANATDLQVLGNLARITNKMFPNIKIEATTSDVLTCSATDGNISMVARIHCLDGAGSTCIDGKKFFELVSRASGKVTFDEGVIKFSKSKFKLPVTSADNFVEIKPVNGDITTLDAQEIINTLKKTVFASAQNTQSILDGVCVNDNELAATDGNILTFNTLTNGLGNNFIFNRVLCDEIIKCFNNDENLDIIANDTKIMIKTTDFILISTLIQGQYPKYKQLVPKEMAHSVTLDKQVILDTLDLLSIVKNLKTNVCILEFTKDNLCISANNNDDGEGSTNLDVDYSDEDFKIAFNIDYLKSALKNACDDVFSFEFSQPLSATLINGNVLLMPVQVR